MIDPKFADGSPIPDPETRFIPILELLARYGAASHRRMAELLERLRKIVRGGRGDGA